MLPSKHFIFGTIFAFILVFTFPQIGFIGFIIIIASTLAIDIDHYFYYVYLKKDLSIVNAYNWVIKNGIKFQKMNDSQKKEIYLEICIFHGVEAIFLLFILFAFFKSPFYLLVLTGFVFHQCLDLIGIISAHIFPYKILSATSCFLQSKNKISLEDFEL
jgi:hypothetical protein